MTRRQGDDEGTTVELNGVPFFVLPDYMENWSLMTKKEFLAIQEIYQYQDMDASQVSAVFFRLGVQKGANLFYLMLQSFKIAARVANAAWGLFEMLRTEEGALQQLSSATVEELTKLGGTLHDYSPDNFRPHIRDLEFAAACFEQFYNEAAIKGTKEEVEELLFEWTKKLQDQLEEKRAGYVAPTVQEVVVAAKRTPVSSE